MKLRGFAGECNRLGRLLSEGSTCGPLVLGTNSAAGTHLSVLSSADPFSQALNILYKVCAEVYCGRASFRRS